MNKRFIEESFPVKEVSREAAREKNIRHGHISTLHIWWARRPLASSRATAYAALVGIRNQELGINGRSTVPVGRSTVPVDRIPVDKIEEWNKKRNFIIDFSKWENSLNQYLIEKARKDILAANGGKPPKVLDPFAGGGSIPLEALRLGCETYAHDLNPVAMLILKCTLEYPQKYGKPTKVKIKANYLGQEIEEERTVNPLLEDVKKWGDWVLEEAKREIGRFYPPDPDGSIPVGYLWARTIPCQNPVCGAEIPLMRQFWLAKKAGQPSAVGQPSRLTKKVSLFPYIKDGQVKFKIVGTGYAEMPADFSPENGTVARAVAVCPVCGAVVDDKTTRRLFQEGLAGQRMVAVVLHKPGTNGKRYRIATEEDLEIFNEAEKYLDDVRAKLMIEWGMDPVPDEPILIPCHDVDRPPMYGMKTWGEIFNARQKLALITFVEKVREAHKKMVGQPSSVDQKNQSFRLTKQKSIKEFTITRRHLPHWQSPNAIYFITTHCMEGKTLSPSQRDIVLNAIKYLDGKKYILYAAVVMPDHFHLVVQPVEKGDGAFYSLSEIMHSIKSFTAHKIDEPIWQHENFDRIIRNEGELLEKINYIINNAIKTGIVENPDDYKWLFYIGDYGQPSRLTIINGVKMVLSRIYSGAGTTGKGRSTVGGSTVPVDNG